MVAVEKRLMELIRVIGVNGADIDARNKVS